MPVSASLAELSAKIEALVPLKDVISSLVLKVDQLLALKSAVDELHKSMQSVEQSMDFLSKKYEEMRASEAKRQVTIDKLETDVASLRSLVSKQSKKSPICEREQTMLSSTAGCQIWKFMAYHRNLKRTFFR